MLLRKRVNFDRENLSESTYYYAGYLVVGGSEPMAVAFTESQLKIARRRTASAAKTEVGEPPTPFQRFLIWCYRWTMDL